MPLDKKKNCIYECNKEIQCEYSDCNSCQHKPKSMYYASGMSLVDGHWQSCGWPIEASSFLEAAQIATSDKTFRVHSLSDNVVY